MRCDEPVLDNEKRQVECLPLFVPDKPLYGVIHADIISQTKTAIARRLTSRVSGCIAADRPDRSARGVNRRGQEASVLILRDKLNRRLIPGDIKVSGCSGTDRGLV